MKQSTKDKIANDMVSQAEALAEAQNDIDNVNEKEKQEIQEFAREHPEVSLVLNEANDLVKADEDMSEGWRRANAHALKHYDELKDPDEWDTETVVDEKVKEEQKEDVEQDLKDEIVSAFE